METLFHASLVILPVLYTLLVMAYAKIFVKRPSGLALFVRPLLLVTVGIHLATLLIRGWMVGGCPLGRPAEYLGFVSLSLAVIYLILEVRAGDRSTGVFALVLVFALQFVATVSILTGDAPANYPKGVAASTRLFSVAIGYAGATMAMIYAWLYLFLYGSIKGGRYGLFFHKVPALETLSDLNRVSGWIAVVTLVIAMGVGFWEGVFSVSRIDVILTLVLIVLLGGAVLASQFGRLGGKRLAYTTVFAFLLVIGFVIVELAPGGARG